MGERWVALDGVISVEPPALQRITEPHDFSNSMDRREAVRALIKYQEEYRAELQDEVNSIIGEIAAARAELGQERFAE